MSRETLLKFAQVIAIVAVVIGVDQWTKMIASDRLATDRSPAFHHKIFLEVPEDFKGETLKDYLTYEFGDNNTEDEINRIVYSTVTDGNVLVNSATPVKPGDKFEVGRREIIVIKDYWDYQYTRNPGAAFSFLADSNSNMRTPFFIGVSFLAVIIIFWILAGVGLRQQLLIWGLSFVCGGAIGNLIDRVSYEYVIDFIVWKWTDAYRWPTFNLADAFICIGVGFMVIEMIRDTIRERKEKAEGKSGETAESVS